MDIEKQVCSLGLAKKLKELEVKQISIWYWTPNPMNRDWEKPQLLKGRGSWDEYCSAFTVAELGELLPLTIFIDDEDYLNESVKWDKTDLEKNTYISYEVSYIGSISTKSISKEDKTEANARAKTLIWLIENKHINPKK